MPVDYGKWDKIACSDDEEEVEDKHHKRLSETGQDDERDRVRTLQTEVDRWLGRQIAKLKREEQADERMGHDDPQRYGGYGDYGGRKPAHSRGGMGGGMMGGLGGSGFGGGGFGGFGGGFGGGDMGGGDMDGGGLGGYGGGLGGRRNKNALPVRNVTQEERKVLAMLITLSDFVEGETNLTKHPEVLELVRHHRWLESDPGTLELCCRIHNGAMRRAGKKKNVHDEDERDDPEDGRMREMLMCGINTLAAPKRAKISGGILALVTQICTPENDVARENRRKWQQKDFAKDALFDSLFPDLRSMADEDKESDSMWEIWLLLFLIAVIIICIVAFMWFGMPAKVSAAGANATNATNASSIVAAGVEGVASALGNGAGIVGTTAATAASAATLADTTVAPLAAPANDAATQLRSLEALRDAGALSEEMFEQARQRVLGTAASTGGGGDNQRGGKEEEL